MQEENNSFKHQNDEIDLREVLHVLLEGKWIIGTVVAFFSVTVVFFSLSLPNIYQSRALLTPIAPTDNISGALSSYSGLINLAGVRLPSQGAESNAVKAMEKMHSLSFFESDILPNINLPELMAMDSWDPMTNEIKFNEDIYLKASNKWVRKFSYPKKLVPSAQESFERFHKRHFFLSEDKKTGFISLRIQHQSPLIAKEWAELVIDQINTFYREKDKTEAEKAVNYLNNQIRKTNLAEIKEVIANLLQQETQKLTLIEASEAYVFDYIDPPAVMEKKIAPTRSKICIIGALLGGIFGVLIVLLRHYFFRK